MDSETKILFPYSEFTNTTSKLKKREREGGEEGEREEKTVKREKRGRMLLLACRILLLKSLDILGFFKYCFVSLYNLESLKLTNLL